MNNLSLTFSWTASWDYSEWMTDLSYTHLNYMTTFTTFSWFLPYLGGGSVGNLTPALLPLHLFARGGAGGVAGWVLPCLPPLLTCGQGGGAAGRGQPLHMTILPILRPTLKVPRNFSSQNLFLTHILVQSNCWFYFGGGSSSSSSLLLTFPVITFNSPLIFSYDACVKRTIKPFYKIRSYNIPSPGREGDNLWHA